MKAKALSGPVFFCFVFVFLSCAAGLKAPDPQKVAALTGGRIERNSPIELRFTEKQDITAPFSANAFRLVPRAEGSLSWKDAYTLVFTPQRALRANTRYRAEVRLGTPFAFTFETQPPLLEISFDPVRIDEDGNVFISGALRAEQGAPLSRVEDVVRASELGAAVWTHEGDTHSFSFGGQRRLDTERTVAVSWNGRRLGSKEKGFATFRIPRAGSFEVMDIRQSGPGVLEVSFSSPLKEDQDLRGFVSLSGSSPLRYAIDGNIARIFGGGEIPPGTGLSIQGLQDSRGIYLAEPVQYRTGENWELPELRFTGSGTVLPSSQGSTMVVETKNLSGLLVEAFEIHGDNMIQFLQVNSLDGTRELDRVGEPVWVRAFDFEWREGDRNRWVRRGLDLSGLAERYPDGMFHIRISFRRRHVHYVCTSGHADFSGLDFPPDTFPAFSSEGGEKSYWDGYEHNRRDNYDYYRYRNDPCHPAFYEPYYDHDITKGRNVLVSDLGLLAKRGLDGTYLVAARDLRTTGPAAGADIELVNYQGSVLGAVKTGPDGTAAISGSGAAAFVRAKSNGNRAYLKINDSLALAVSHFDVSGDRPSSGVKGLIYGERGVWRPGDTIYLTFLLSDPAFSLPENHPVSFELEDPRGRITEQRTYTSSVDGFYPIAVSTSRDAPTGDWTARVRVGGSVFNKSIKIETVMPNRLKMDLDFPGGYLEAAPVETFLSAAWLYGAPAPNLKADVSVTFADRETSFPSFTDYTFRDPSRTVSPERLTVFSGNLDASGRAGFTMNLNPGRAVPGRLRARFLTRVFEPSGVFSSEQTTVDFSPYSRYVGIKLPRGDASRDMLLTDQDHPADIVVLDSGGHPVSGVELDCAIYKLSWRWWWEQGGGEEAAFSQALSRTPVARGTATTSSDGRAVWNFQVKYPDWGRYMVIARDARGGHSAASIVYIDWPGWAGRAQEGGQGAAAMLILTPEKRSYSSGERAGVSFPSNSEAVAMVTLERGGEVLRNEWINCSDTVTRYEFTADLSMTPNVYVHVTLLQKHLQTGNDLPLRLYGVVPVIVDDPSMRLKPLIASSSNWEPESTVSFTVSEESGRPMAYTAVVVDEGLLGLTRFSLPNPRTGFYAREASFLKSWDLYSQVMGAYAGQLETLLAIGGGDEFFDDTAKETTRFKPVVRYFGPYELAAGASRTEEFTLPPYVGAVRVMVLAASSSGARGTARPTQAAQSLSRRAYGTAEKSVTVSTDLMVFGTVPRTLSPGDEAVIPVSVNLYKEGGRQVTLTFSAEGGADLVQGQSA
ncbi:MAG: alpha-2-macroglobulin, partial [Spirochaetaceae bacterium]|nr:alpha-2-macroglobulin [Spirochaetaceae bacterium]